LSTDRPHRPLKYVPRDCTCDGLRVRIKFMGLYGRPPLALAGLLVKSKMADGSHFENRKNRSIAKTI